MVRNPAHFEGLFRRLADAQAVASPVPSTNPVCRPLAIYAELVEGGHLYYYPGEFCFLRVIFQAAPVSFSTVAFRAA
jgi:hypothetical protein